MVRKPYIPFDTGWIGSVMSTGWFALINGLLPEILFCSWWNTCAPKIMLFLETIGLGCMLLGSVIIHLEHQVFTQVDCYGPVFDMIQYVGSMVPEIDLGPDLKAILPSPPCVEVNRNRFQAPSRRGRPDA